MDSHIDDEELSMSLSSPPDRNVPVQPPPARSAKPPQVQSPRSFATDLPKNGKLEQRIGMYSVKKTLGEGSFGKVKLAVHRVSGQEVALKIISRRKLISRDMAGRVEREIQYLQLLRHPHIIKLYTVITTPNEIIMVLEFAGDELFDYIVKHGKMAENKARRFFQQIVCAVEYCHRHKIVHRDLKPENLLLDEHLNVKIADFGLSNIMTDGNFLKTSCGSPNYAAPEVISGKLYAGPEVDVWSCGIILYVLLVGRLPFDDDYIPALFKKISAGTYHTPSYLSSGARHVLHRMLKVNPVQRITIQEIRQDPWFNENLEEYLKPPVEEFIDTGVDPNKAIDPRKLAPGKPPAVQEQIHQSVIGKLGKTMGYAKDDVQEALGTDEPNAIKDAYMIVRENQIMRNNPALTKDDKSQPFMATSPPAWDAPPPGTPRNVVPYVPNLDDTPTSEPPRGISTDITALPKRVADPALAADGRDNYISKISFLTSSLPTYHNQFMEQQKEAKRRREAGEELPIDIKVSEARDIPKIERLSVDPGPHLQSPEEQAETARRLKPVSLSTLQLQSIIAQPLTRIPDEQAKPEAKKHKTRWQFGIRSRNQPHEAMHCVYKALIAMGAEWEIPALAEEPAPLFSYPVYVEGATRLNETMHQSRAASPELGRKANRMSHEEAHNPDGSGEVGRGSRKRNDQSCNGDETEDEDIDPHLVPTEYVPKDPWVIRARWRKDGMTAAGIGHSLSTNSSRQDLDSNPASRRASLISSNASANASNSDVHEGGKADSKTQLHSIATAACYVYMDIQLYTLDAPSDKNAQGTYLVDFKCAGYEPLVELKGANGEKELLGIGYRLVDKDVTSPQPFLDMTNQLVIYLAGERS